MSAIGRFARWPFVALALALPAAVVAEPADIFVGTLAREGTAIILRRCDIADNRYILVDAPGSHALTEVGKATLPAYGEVIARYMERDGRSILQVEQVDNLTPGKNCHLVDAVGDMFEKSAAAPPAPAAPEKPRPDASFAGHYYLSGVRETGSELLLAADGTFQWFLSFGAVDQAARGIWRRVGDALVLTATTPATDKPLFAYLETEPWSRQAEEEMRRREHDAKSAAIRAACPFLTDAWVSTPVATMVAGDAPAQPADILRRNAANARAAAVDLRARVEQLSRQVMGAGSPRVSDAAAEQARTLLGAWMTARETAQEAARAAGLPDPALGDPALPAACIVPPVDPVGDAPATWRGGIGARVFNRANGQGARDVRVRLRFADGHEEDIVTAGRGLAMLPGKQKRAAIGATLVADYAKGHDADFTFPAVRSGIVHFSIDAQQLSGTPFETLRLKIVDGALVPEEFGRGRYERQP